MVQLERNGKRSASDGPAEGWVVKGLGVDERLPDMQQFIHEHTSSLHFGERVVFPPLQIGKELSKAGIVLDHAQAGEVEQRAQVGATLMEHRSPAALLLAGSLEGRLDPS